MRLCTSTFTLALLVVGCTDADQIILAGCTLLPGEMGTQVLRCADGTSAVIRDDAVGNADVDDPEATPAATALVRLDPETPGGNCESGGSALKAGLDLDADQRLADDEVTTTKYVCNGPAATRAERIQGSFTVTNSLDVSTLATVSHITGDLMIRAPGLTELSLPALTRVDGTLQISDSDDLLSISLPNLSTVGELLIANNDKLVSVAANLSGAFSVNVVANAELENLAELGDLSSLSNIGVTSNPKLETLAGFEGVQSLGSLVLSGNSLLSDLSALSELTSVSEDLTLVNNAALELTSFGNLSSVGGTFSLVQSTLVTLNSFPALTSIGALDVSDNPLLTDISLPALTTVSGTLSITQNPLLATLSGLNAVSSVGSYIFIRHNGSAFGGGVDGSYVPSGVGSDDGDVRTTILVFGNAELTAIPDFPEIKTVGSSVVVLANPKLESTGLVALESVGDLLEFRENTTLVTLRHPALESVPLLIIANNPALLSVDFDTLASVSRQLHVNGNAQLPQCLADQLVEQLAPPPSEGLYVNENDALAVCP